ncbi:MAG: histidine phosphatase family protein [Actinobacteria bacterium]|nr:histidine phosphatase family protein [Actinomycetota bacterium]
MTLPATADADHPADTGRIFLIRHGETEWSSNGRHTGTTDIALTDHGRAQATALGPELATIRFAQIRTSPMTRAIQTARLAGLVDPEPIIDPDLVEWNYGDYEGVTSDEIHRDRPGWTIFADDAPGGETADQVAARVDRVLARTKGDVDGGGDVALVAHGHVLRVLASRWLGRSGRFGSHLALDAASLSVLGTEHDVPLLRTWNRCPGLPTDLGGQSEETVGSSDRVRPSPP